MERSQTLRKNEMYHKKKQCFSCSWGSLRFSWYNKEVDNFKRDLKDVRHEEMEKNNSYSWLKSVINAVITGVIGGSISLLFYLFDIWDKKITKELKGTPLDFYKFLPWAVQ
jgi:hypothetical protein